jgi:hypothetical protein
VIRVRFDDGHEAELPDNTPAQYEPTKEIGSGVDRRLRRRGLAPISFFPKGLRLLIDLNERDSAGRRVFRFGEAL